MITITLYDNMTGRIINPVTIHEDDLAIQDSYIVGEFDPDSFYVKDGTAVAFPTRPTEFHIWDYQYEGWVENVIAAKSQRVKEVKENYSIVSSGKDPATGKSIYVDCTISTGTIRMNAGKAAAENMDGGVRIYERAGATEMPVVRDFYNVNHLNVPMADAIAISKQQGADALGYWQQKGAMVDAINAATTVAEVEAVDITFAVNVE